LSVNDVVLGLFIGHTETRNRYNIKHPDPRNIGISGATPSQWGKFLKKRKIPINSLRAGVEIYKYYLKQCSNNHICAMEKYKGIQSDKTKPMAVKFVKQYKEVLALELKRNKIKTKGNK
jgi:hypothetical protein